jgi:hypothetical protein
MIEIQKPETTVPINEIHISQIILLGPLSAHNDRQVQDPFPDEVKRLKA